MPRAESSIVIHAPPASVAARYRDVAAWPALFPETIRGVRLVAREPRRVTVEVLHRQSGTVPNVLTEVSPTELLLWEERPRYVGTFVNRFEAVAEGTRYTVTADIRLKGLARVLGPFVGPVIRRRMRRYVLEPMRRACEGAAG
jgi:hypothetical protein